MVKYLKHKNMNNLSTPFDKIVEPVITSDYRINETVKKIMSLTDHGKKFNAEIDINNKYKDIASALYDLMEKVFGIYVVNIIVTGKFGRFIRNWIEHFGFDYDVVYELEEGESLEIFKEDLRGTDFIIMNDIVPENQKFIREHVESLGGIYKGTFVIYNQRENSPEIYSLY